MGWETRRGKRYYYRKEWIKGGRVRSIYCGGGERGARAEAEDERRRGGEVAPVETMPAAAPAAHGTFDPFRRLRESMAPSQKPKGPGW